ncbi:purine catabolism regulator [Melghirimyces profundicolus]|uniref:Purine catabolism regulator n=1 Tax=Melghirimyces profundicolus TaxID=1242148 RepID=A0A2T6C8G7_9BACL|nr:PucR family transcriptional regulator [Melghirimyces profundicolus]PTX64614.1 purine catabolism regulator [Melghirimyces profundicolus]
MHSTTRFTVRDALDRPLFATARVLAGKDSLDRTIRWVHILEVTRFEHLISGGEMILTTGIAFRSGTDSPLAYLRKLIDLGVSCLCIELGEYFTELPREMVELAESRGFPLVVFEETVRFVDITQDLHSLLIHRHYDRLKQLESLSRTFHRLTLSPQGLENILKLLHTHTGHTVLFVPAQGRPRSVPMLPPEERDSLFVRIQDDLAGAEKDSPPYRREHAGRPVLLQPVQAMGQTWAFLGLVCHATPEEYESLILDWSSLAIAQDLLRKRYLEERKLHTEHLWVDDWLHDRMAESDLEYYLGSDYDTLASTPFRVCLLELPEGNRTTSAHRELDAFRYEISLIVRSTFEKQGFRPFITLHNARLAVIAFNRRSEASERDRLRQVFENIRRLCRQAQWNFHPLMGAGRLCRNLLRAPECHREAHQVLTVNRREPVSPFYEDLGIYQLLLHPGGNQNLTSFVREHLGPLINHDREKGSDLLTTLKVYLDHNGSKKEVAEKLYIVRQSLYYRLQKIGSLLGEDYLSPDKKLTLQVALRACRMVYPELVKETGEKT